MDEEKLVLPRKAPLCLPHPTRIILYTMCLFSIGSLVHFSPKCDRSHEMEIHWLHVTKHSKSLVVLKFSQSAFIFTNKSTLDLLNFKITSKVRMANWFSYIRYKSTVGYHNSLQIAFRIEIVRINLSIFSLPTRLNLGVSLFLCPGGGGGYSRNMVNGGARL